MLSAIPPSDCLSARESVSAGLDGELSELEVAGLDKHLRDCAECRLFANQLRALHSELSAAPLEQAQIQVFAPAFVPARRRSLGRHGSLGRLRAAVAVAAMVAVAGGSSFAVGRIVGAHGGPAETTLARTTALDFLSLQADSREQHLRAMLQQLPSDSLHVGSLIAV